MLIVFVSSFIPSTKLPASNNVIDLAEIIIFSFSIIYPNYYFN